MKCNFCGIPISKETFAVTGLKNIFICEKCIEQAYRVTTRAKHKVQKETFEAARLTPSQIKAKLDEYVVGQEEAKYVLSIAIYNHYKMLKQMDFVDEENQDTIIEKSNILILGPTGSGKTFLLKTLARIIDVPFAIADATSITESGYVGADAETMLQKLIQAADGDLAKAEQGIIFIDEIDKITRKSENPSITRDVGGEGVQQTLLKIIEGSIVDVQISGLRRHPNADTVQMDTSKILFVCGGSFEGIEKIIEKRLSQNTSIGFNQTKTSKKKLSVSDAMAEVTTDDVRKFGIIPELLGRLPIITSLRTLDEQALVDILIKPKNALYKQYQKLFEMDDLILDIAEDAFIAIANEAIKRETGARSLRSIMEELLRPYMYKLPDMQDAKILYIDKQTVLKEKEAEIKKNKVI